MSVPPGTTPQAASGASLPAFTQGPWRVAYRPAYYPTVDERRLEVACLPHSTFDALEVFAPARGEDGHYAEPSLEEFDATARLIAAAPDGFAAARATYIRLLQLVDSRHLMQPELCALRDYLAKATGRDPQAVQDECELAAADTTEQSDLAREDH